MNATRSKHSVTEQWRRSKINERFQVLRDLIPHNDHKRDTASFLLEVNEYIQYLQEKLQKYEGPYQEWTAEPSKLMPCRNSHRRVQSFSGHPQAMKNGTGPFSLASGKFEENNISISPIMLTNAQKSVEFDPMRDAACQLMDQQSEVPASLQANVITAVRSDNVLPNSVHRPVSDAQLTECHASSSTLNQQEELMVEGGTISISSVYSQGLLNSVTSPQECRCRSVTGQHSSAD